MSRQEALARYKAAVSVFKNWHESGIITDADFAKIDAAIAQKYGISILSIYRENDLLCSPNRANILPEVDTL
jgi:K+/H+ antiporter YhaU regulatory subunit KhtT